MTTWRYDMSFLDKVKKTFKSIVTGVKYFDYNVMNSDEDNYKVAERYIDSVIKANDEIVQRNIRLDNYVVQDNCNEFMAYLLSNKVIDAVDKRDKVYDAAMEYFIDVMNIERKNIESAVADLVVMARARYDELGLKQPEHIDVYKLINEGFFFEGDANKRFDSIKRAVILTGNEPEDEFDRAFYRYNNALILSDIYIGFTDVLMQLYEYVEYKDEELSSFYDAPVYRKALTWMENMNKGPVFAIEKALVDSIFDKHDKLWKAEKQEYGMAVVYGDTSTPKAQHAKEMANLHRVFEHEAGYMRTRPVVTTVPNGLGDERKTIFSSVDLTTLVEFAYDIKELRVDAMRIVDYMLHEFGGVPEDFVNSETISELLPENVAVFKTTDELPSDDTTMGD